MALSVGNLRGTHSRYVIGCCLIPLGISCLENNSRRITYGIRCVWGMSSLSPLSSLVAVHRLRTLQTGLRIECFLLSTVETWLATNIEASQNLYQFVAILTRTCYVTGYRDKPQGTGLPEVGLAKLCFGEEAKCAPRRK